MRRPPASPLRPAAGLAILVLLAPAVQATHDNADSIVFSFGPYIARLDVPSDGVVAGRNATWSLYLGTPSPAPSDIVVSFEARLDLMKVNGTFTATSRPGTSETKILFPIQGSWNLTLHTYRGGHGPSGSTSFVVFRDVGWAMRPVSANVTGTKGEPLDMTFRMESTGGHPSNPVPKAKDVAARIQGTDEFGKPVGEPETAGLEARNGTWVLRHTFPRTSHYHLTFASESANVVFGDLPPQHVDVALREPSPGFDPKPLVVLAALAFVAAAAFWPARARK